MKRQKNNAIIISIIFILFAVILSTTIILIQVLYFDQRAQKVALSNGLNKMQEREAVVENYLEDVDDGLVSLRDSKFFNAYLNQSEEEEILEELFMIYVKSNKDIMQVRYIDEAGMEKVRVGRDVLGEEAVVVQESELQNKSGRHYFENSKDKPLEEIWMTSIDLNVEDGQIQIPYVPTMRVVLPIEKDQEFGGILVVNYFVKPLLEELTYTPLYDMILCDEDGYIIYYYDHIDENQDKCWGNVLEHQYNISMEFPDNYEAILNSQVLEEEQFVSRHFDLPLDKGLIMILQLRESYLVEEENRTYNEYITIFIIIFIFSILLTFLIIKFFGHIFLNLNKVNKLNDSLKTASQIAKIGFYEYSSKTQEIYWYNGIEAVFEEAITDKKMSFSQFLLYMPEEDKKSFVEDLDNSIDNKSDLFVSHQLNKRNGETIYVEQRIKHVFNRNGHHIQSFGSIYDVTKYVEALQKIKEQTYIDFLTQLQNRKSYNEKLHDLIEQYKRYDITFSMAMMDVDLFKSINDIYGHSVGDKVLKELADLLKDNIRVNDDVFRIGGEEFLVLLIGTGKEQAVAFAEKVRRTVQNELKKIIEEEREITVSIGVTEVCDDDSFDSIFSRADRCLYAAKENGRNSVVAE